MFHNIFFAVFFVTQYLHPRNSLVRLWVAADKEGIETSKAHKPSIRRPGRLVKPLKSRQISML